MNLFEAIHEMSELRPATEATVKQMLDDDYHVIFADKSNYGDVLKYDLFVEDGILYCCKMFDSSRDSIVLTPETAAIYTPEWFHILWESYLSRKDRVIVDTVGHMHSAAIRTGSFTFDSIKAQLQDKEVFHFDDYYSPGENLDVPDVSIYVIDIGIPAITDVLADTIAVVKGATMVSDPSQADLSILPMPPGQQTNTNRLFTGVDWDSKENRQVKKLFTPMLSNGKANGVLSYMLLFHTHSCGKLVAKGKEEAQLRAAADLASAIAEFCAKTGK